MQINIHYKFVLVLILLIRLIKLDFYLEINQEERCLIESFNQNKEVMLKLKLI